MNEFYRVNAEDIMHETIDGEVVIVNLDSGAYYAFDGSGEYIWDRLSNAGASAEQLVTELEQRFSSPSADIAAGVTQFLKQLRDEALIEPGEDNGVATANAGAPALSAEFKSPQLNKYTDMESLLLADPIHEVEPEGWPHVKS